MYLEQYVCTTNEFDFFDGSYNFICELIKKNNSLTIEYQCMVQNLILTECIKFLEKKDITFQPDFFSIYSFKINKLMDLPHKLRIYINYSPGWFNYYCMEKAWMDLSIPLDVDDLPSWVKTLYFWQMRIPKIIEFLEKQIDEYTIKASEFKLQDMILYNQIYVYGT